MSMFMKLVALVACVEARFGQEQIPVSAVSALSNFGQPGQAATLAGGVPGVLLAAANPCDKLTLADKIVTELGSDPSVISAAAGVVAAEQNFNPFIVSVPSICNDATLPATQQLRGIVPLVDPAVVGSDTENANSATSLKTPFSATGMSVAQVIAANGFSNFTAVDASGNKASVNGSGATSNSGAASSSGASSNSSSSSSSAASSNANVNSASSSCSGGAARNSNSTANSASSASSSSSSSSGAATNATATGNTTSLAGADFGLCTPTMDFQFGRAQFNRKATEGTFLPTDPLVAKGQQDALNPNIITNRICDQLTNVCNANQSAKDACQSAKAMVASLGTKDQTTADAFNKALGF